MDVSFTANTHTHAHTQVTMHQSQLLSGCKLLWRGCYNLHLKVRVEERTKALIFLRWLEITLTSLGLAWFRVSVHSPNWAHSRNPLAGLRCCLRISTVLIHMEASISVLISSTHTKSRDQHISKVAQIKTHIWLRKEKALLCQRLLCEQLTSAASIHQTMEVFPCSTNKKKGDNKWPFTISNYFALITVFYAGDTLLQWHIKEKTTKTTINSETS